MSPFINVAMLLINFLFGSFIFIFLLRIILQLAKADYFTPLSQFVLKFTNPILIPVRKIIPNYLRLDLGALILVFIIELIKLYSLPLVNLFNVSVITSVPFHVFST